VIGRSAQTFIGQYCLWWRYAGICPLKCPKIVPDHTASRLITGQCSCKAVQPRSLLRPGESKLLFLWHAFTTVIVGWLAARTYTSCKKLYRWPLK
jgi:hypothetical protein